MQRDGIKPSRKISPNHVEATCRAIFQCHALKPLATTRTYEVQCIEHTYLGRYSKHAQASFLLGSSQTVCSTLITTNQI
jgi:hypothetical protein